MKVDLSKDGRHAILLEPLTVLVDYCLITVPEGFETDFASVPRLFWNIIPPTGKYARAAVVHDFLYTNHSFDRKKCDRIFYLLMREDGVNWFTANAMWAAVRAFGFAAW